MEIINQYIYKIDPLFLIFFSVMLSLILIVAIISLYKLNCINRTLVLKSTLQDREISELRKLTSKNEN